MMWLILFNSCVVLSVKNPYVNSFFSMDVANVHVFSLVFLATYIICVALFNFFPLSEKLYSDFFIFLNVALGAAFLSNKPLYFLIFMEMSTLLMFFSFLKLSKDKDKISAVIFMVFFNIFGSVPFIYFIVFKDLNAFTDLYNFSMFKNFSLFLTFSTIFILFSKVPLMFMHFWLTKAHVAGSGACSMILASIMLKLGTLGLLKFSTLFFSMNLSFMFSFCVLGASMVIIVMIRFFDVKLCVACSSVVHMGLIPPFLLFSSSISVYPSCLMMVGHGITSLFLFLVVSVIYENSLNRSFDVNKSQESFSKFLGICIFIFIFLNLGVPPFISFVSEFLMVYFLISYSLFVTLFFCLTMILMLVFTMFFLTKSFFGKKLINPSSLNTKLMVDLTLVSWFFFSASLI